MTERAAQFTIALAQLNPTVGDIAGNAAKARAAPARKARAAGADLVVLSELFIAGYPPEDLVLKPALQSDVPRRDRGVRARHRRRRPGGADRHALGRGRQALQCLRAAGRRPGRGHALQGDLPNYGVFDEKRVFAPRPCCRARSNIRGVRRRRSHLRGHLDRGSEYENVVECLAETGAEILIVPNGSPYRSATRAMCGCRSRWRASPRAGCR